VDSVKSLMRISSVRYPNRVLHAIVRTGDVFEGRLNVSRDEESLQVSVIPLSPGASMVPHYHHVRPDGAAAPRETQECWIVIRGEIRAQLFDENHAFLADALLREGDLLVTFGGGHAFSDAKPSTLIIECKNGPYIGRDYTQINTAP
jgi:mannose-6-phosphate isomerase-like protein (cupin superfamily)